MDKAIDALAKQYTLLEYFRNYLKEHLDHDLASFDDAISAPEPHVNAVSLTDAER